MKTISPVLVRVPTNQLYERLHDCICDENGPDIPVRGDTNRGGKNLMW